MNSKTVAGIGIGIAVVIIAVAVFAISPEQNGIEPTTQNENIGLVVNAPTSEITVPQLDQIYEEAASTGVGRSNVYLFWNLIEPEKGNYNFRESDVFMSLNKKHDLKVTLYFSIINGKTLGPFPDWMGKPRLHAVTDDQIVTTLDAILDRYNTVDTVIDTVIIAGETDEHFRHNEELIPIYKELFNNVYDKIKVSHPDVKFGNSFSLHGVINKNLDHIVSELSDGDFVGFTYFPTDSLNEIQKNPVDEATADLEKAIELAPDKKILFFEVSWSTSDFVRGTIEDQLDFVLTSFNFYREHDEKIESFTWYRQYDKPEGTCIVDLSEVEGTLSVGTSEFVVERLSHYICNAGLLDVDGKPKPAWDQFKKEIHQLQ